jgi:Mg/Co/Ni transporter MgtE
MKPPRAEDLHAIVSQQRWDRVIGILGRLAPEVAADAFLSLPYEDQQALFQRLPADLAAKLAPIFAYYHTFALLHTLSMEQRIAILERMNPIERYNFLEELPEEPWQQLVSELSAKESLEGTT